MKYSVSVVLREKINDKNFLAVKRPYNDEEHPGMWGLPAISFKPPETPETAVKRLGLEKLGCLIEPYSFLGAFYQERPSYKLILFLYEAYVKEGHPDVRKGKKGTIYIDQIWTENYEILFPIARKGSACCQLFLYHLGMLKEEDLLTKLTKEDLK
jgi:ADP-ribose pyrophosphatase YjhB (NUDIX family)